MNPKEQNLLQFKSFNVSNINLSILPEGEVDNDLEVELNTKPIFGSKKSFTILFDLKITNGSKSVNVELKAIGSFDTSKEITDEFKKSHFVRVNAPAIVFPYIRAFISTVSVNCGYDPIVIPTFNFLSVKKKED